MKLKKEADGWWIKSSRADVEDMGPYNDKAEAAEDLKGVLRSLEWLDKKEAQREARRRK